MLNKLEVIGSSAWYWLALAVAGLSMEAVALIYQYVLEYLPCVLCIHARIWVLGFILLALLALLLRGSRSWLVMLHLLNTVVMAGLLERAWLLLGTERGTVEGSCEMDLGFPGWFALDAWFPWMFRVWEPCGYTPELLFGITMAEALVVFSAVMVLVSAALTVATLLGRN